MPTFEICNIINEQIVVRELNSNCLQTLTMIPNTGTEFVSFYDKEGNIWDFKDGPMNPADLQVGDQLILRAIVPNPE